MLQRREVSMRLLLRILALVIFGPVILGLLIILAVVAIIGIPLLWEQLMARFSSPPGQGPTTT
jgi:hypothetical protein